MVVKKEIKKDQNEIKETTIEKKEVKKEEPKKLRNIYLMDYCIKDLTQNKIIETNIETKAKQPYEVVFLKETKSVFEGIHSTFPKVEEALKNMKENEEKTLILEPKEAYGIRSKEALRVVSLSTFTQNQIRPIVGLTIQADNNLMGTIKSVSGGRVLVDFNSIYADHKIEFYLKKKQNPTEKQKIELVLKTFFGKLEPKVTEFANQKASLSIKASKDAKLDVYKQIFEGALKEFVEVKEIKIEAE